MRAKAWIYLTSVVLFFQISEKLVIFSVWGEVLELGDKLVHQALDGDGNDGALDDELGSRHDDDLQEGEGEDVAQQPVFPFVQHGGETGADTQKRGEKEKSVDKLGMEIVLIQQTGQNNRTI